MGGYCRRMEVSHHFCANYESKDVPWSLPQPRAKTWPCCNFAVSAWWSPLYSPLSVDTRVHSTAHTLLGAPTPSAPSLHTPRLVAGRRLSLTCTLEGGMPRPAPATAIGRQKHISKGVWVPPKFVLLWVLTLSHRVPCRHSLCLRVTLYHS